MSEFEITGFLNESSSGFLALTFDLNHNFRYLVKSILKC